MPLILLPLILVDFRSVSIDLSEKVLYYDDENHYLALYPHIALDGYIGNDVVQMLVFAY